MIFKKYLKLIALLKKLEPIEIVTYVTFIISLCLSVIFSLKFYAPGFNTGVFICVHYFGPLVPALILSSPLFLRRDLQKKDEICRPMNSLRVFIAFVIAVYIHFNLKLWAQLINPLNFDIFYYRIDSYFDGLLSLILWLRMKIITIFPLDKFNAYHDIFVSMFILSFLLHSSLNKKFGEVITGTTIVLLLGGLSYSFAPAMGPFIFEPSVSQTAINIQTRMINFYPDFIKSGGLYFESKFFTSALAAMPSLHIANAAFFTFYAWQEIRWLGILYLPCLFYLIIEAIATKWHYLIDIPVGVLITGSGVYISKFLYRKNTGSTLKDLLPK